MRIHISAAIVALFYIATGSLSAAGSAEGADAATSTAADHREAETAADSFPVTIEHKYGSVTIDAPPQRVVSVGYSEQDALLALGVVPVGLRDWYGNQPFAVWPWAQDELGDATPRIIGLGELDMEAIVALEPDLITGISSGMTAEEYDTLSRIAPTLAQPGEYVDYGTPWDVELRLIARALGRSARAESIIDDIDEQFDAARRSHPEFEGATAAFAFLYQSQPGAYASQDTRSRFLSRLGFEIPEIYDELAGESFFISISEERIDLLDVDVIVWIASTDEGRQAILDLELRERLDAAQEGREIFLDPILGGALSFSSPLSLPYALDRLVPALAAAVDGDPDTAVPADLR